MLSGLPSVSLKFMGSGCTKAQSGGSAPPPRVRSLPPGFDATNPIELTEVSQDQFKASGMSPDEQSSVIRARKVREQTEALIEKRTISFADTVTDNNGSSEPLGDPKAPTHFMTTKKASDPRQSSGL